MSMLRMLAAILVVFFGMKASAAGPACQFNDPANRLPVVYFGGNLASAGQMDSWSAAADASSGANFAFESGTHFNLNMKTSNKNSVEVGAKASIDNCVAKINSSEFKGPVVLVGHSDGSWIVDAIAKKLDANGKKKVRLVSLDGNYEPGTPFGMNDYECWTAYDADIQATPPTSCSAIEPAAASWFTSNMQKCKTSQGKDACRFMPVKGCKGNKVCLHFALINSNMGTNPGSISQKNYDRLGYVNVKPPLDYLKGLAGGGTNDGRRPAIIAPATGVSAPAR